MLEVERDFVPTPVCVRVLSEVEELDVLVTLFQNNRLS